MLIGEQAALSRRWYGALDIYDPEKSLMIKMKNVWFVAVAVMIVSGAVGATLPGTAAAGPLCDGKTTPCPLQKFMRHKVGTPMASGELATIAASMDKIIAWGGPGMPNWAKFAKKTADDARANKTDDVKADCKACHDAYKEAVRNDPTLRNRPAP